MADTGNTRSWQTQPPRRRRVARNWATGASAGNLRSERQKRRLRIAGNLLLLTGLFTAILVALFWPNPLPPLRIVGLALSTYPDRMIRPNPLGREDIQYFQHHFGASVEDWGDKLNREVLLHEWDTLNATDSNLIVYCSFHGMIDPGTGQPGSGDAMLLVSNGLEGRVSVKELLSRIARVGSRNVLLLVDTGRLPWDWRLGVLHNDFAEQLKEDLDREAPENLAVIISSGAGQRSWEDDSVDATLFARTLVEGLEGAADGWHTSPGSGPIDHRVSSDELFWYVRSRVADESGDRGAVQTVWYWPQVDERPAFAFDIREAAPVPRDPPEGDTDDSGTPAVATDSAPEDTSSHPTDASPQATADTTVSAPPTTAGAGPPPAETGSPSAPDHEAAATPGGTAGAASPTVPAASRDSTRQRLTQLWKRRDRLADRPRVLALAPHSWRRLQSVMLHAERQWRAKLWDDADQTLNVAGEVASHIERRLTEPGLQSESENSPPVSLAAAAAFRHDQPTPELRLQLETKLAALFTAQGDAVSEQISQLETFLRDTDRSVHWTFAQAILQQAETADDVTVLQQLLPAMRLLEHTLGLPSELIVLKQLCQLAGSRPDALTVPRLAAAKRALVLRRRAESLVFAAPESLPFVRERLTAGLRALAAAEQWLLRGSSYVGECETWLDRAELELDISPQKLPLLAAIQLRDELYAELPGFSRWMAARMERDRVRSFPWPLLAKWAEHFQQDPTAVSTVMREGEELGLTNALTPQERLLLKLFGHAHSMSTQLERVEVVGSADSDVVAELERSTKDARRDWETLQAALSDHVLDLRNDDQIRWHAIDAALEVPSIPADQRMGLLDQLQRPAVVELSPPAVPSWAGLWQGFWAVQTLGLSHRDDAAVSRLWARWGQLAADVADKQPQLQLVHQRTELGDMIRGEWEELAREINRQRLPFGDSRDRIRAERLVRTVDGMDQPSAGELRAADELLEARRRDGLRDWLVIHAAQSWQPQLNLDVGYGSLCRSLEAWLGRKILEGRSPPQLVLRGESAVEELDLQVGGAETLTVNVTGDSPSGGPIHLYFRSSDHIQITHDGQAVQDRFALSPEMRTLQFHVEAMGDFQWPVPLVVAMVTGDENLPLDIRAIFVNPPIDPTQWRVDFVAAAGGPAVAEIRPRTEGGAKLLLPAFTPEPIALQAVLERPENDATDEVKVTVYRLGDRQPLGGPQTVMFEAGKRRAVIPFPVAASAENAKPDAGGESPPSRIDVARGLKFQIEPRPNQIIDFEVHPLFWPADKYIELPEVTFENELLTVAIRRRHVDDNGHPAAVIPVSLELPEELGALATESLLVSNDLGFEKEVVLYAKLRQGVADEIANRVFEISLSAAGIPHVYRWQIQHGFKPAIAGDERIRIVVVEPADRRMLIPDKDQLRVRFEMDPFLGEAELAYTLVPVNRPAPPSKSIALEAFIEKVVGVEAGEGGNWHFSTEGRDYEREIDINKKSGRFDLTAVLSRGGIELARGVLEIGIDDTPPSAVKAEFELNNAKSGAHFVGAKQLAVVVSAEDEQSGIIEYAVGLDRDDDGAMDGRALAQLRKPPQGESRLVISGDDLPTAAGIVKYVVTATNGVGMSNSVSRTVRFAMPPPGAAPPEELGTLQVNVDAQYSRFEYTWTVKTGEKTVAVKTPGRTASQVFSKLKPGIYDVELASGNRKGTAAGVEIVAGKTAMVTIKPTLE